MFTSLCNPEIIFRTIKKKMKIGSKTNPEVFAYNKKVTWDLKKHLVDNLKVGALLRLRQLNNPRQISQFGVHNTNKIHKTDVKRKPNSDF